MKPNDLKNVARRFIEKHYPDFIGRFDRVWMMFENAPLASLPLSSHEAKDSETGFGISGEADEETKDAITGIAVLAFAYKSVRDKDSISGEEVREKISVVSLDMNLSGGLREKLEEALGDMLPNIPQMAQKKQFKKYARVWSNENSFKGTDIDWEKYDELERTKSHYDIFIVDRGEYERDAVGEIYFNRSVFKDFTSLKYRILFYTLKKDGFPRTAINILENCWFGDEGRIERLKKTKEVDKDQFQNDTNFFRAEISKLNHNLKTQLNVRLISKGTGQYRLDPNVPKYCVIKI